MAKPQGITRHLTTALNNKQVDVSLDSMMREYQATVKNDQEVRLPK